MRELREWFLIMLYLHKIAVPKDKGGSPAFYAKLLLDWDRFPAHFPDENRICAEVLTLYRASKAGTDTLRRVDSAFKKDRPALVTKKNAPGNRKIFILTDEGMLISERLAGGLSEACQSTMIATIGADRFRKRKAVR
ncbi:MAG: hypothetical protein AAB649_05715 [Patescibacteria group bacterium]